MQQRVAKAATPYATLSVMKSGDYWREVCAPKVRAKKQEIGRQMTNREIAAAIEAKSGKRTTRQLLEFFFKGDREPYISQFHALCEVMKLDPVELLSRRPIVYASAHTADRRPAFRVQENVSTSRKPYKKVRTSS